MEPNKETVTLEELVISNMYEIQAVINILKLKGLFTKDEVLEEIKLLKEFSVKKFN